MTSPQAPHGKPLPPRKSRQEARKSIAQLQSVVDRASALLGRAGLLRPMAARQLATLVERVVDAELDRVPVADLRGHMPRSVKLRPLEDAGFATAAAVHKTPEHRLAEVKGVGPQTITAAKRAAKTLRDGLAGDARFRFEPDRPDAAQALLLATLTALRAAANAENRIGAQVRQVRTAAAQLIPAATPATKILVRRAAKDAGLAAVAQIEALLADNRACAEQVEEFTRLVEPGHYRSEQLWKLFREDAAAYYSLLSTFGAPVDDTDAARGHIGRKDSREIAALNLDTRLLKSTLRGYQEFGAQFALHRRRAIIGDEMGLGKTVQALAACAHLAANGRGRFLIVCPASVLFNWLSEIEKHTRLTPYKLHGDGREEIGRQWLASGGVAVTTFDTLARLRCLDGTDYIDLLAVDEAHNIKNPERKRSQAVLPFIDRAERTLFLSGTPMENRVEEFRSLVAYLRPRTAARIAPDTALSGARSFRRKVADVYLRRNQIDVLHELPEMIEVEDWVQFSDADLTVYRRFLQEPPSLGLLEKLRHAAYQSTDSAKLDRVLELAGEACDEGLKVVVFSRYLDVLARIKDGLRHPVAGSLTGSVPVPKRQALIDAFSRREDAAVLLSQIDTGGTGINLQSASVVIITEPQWKPSTEDQATARLHRMGQTRTVQVHRVLAKASVDELLLEVQERKRLLFDEFARKSAAKDADQRSVEATARPAFLDDESIPLKLRVVMAEQHRLQRPAG